MIIFKKTEWFFVAVTLGVIFLVSLINYQTSEAKARDTHRIESVSLISDALEDYFYDYDRYPASDRENGKIKACGSRNSEPCDWGQKFEIYMELPNDPIPSRRFYYEASSDGQKYKIWAALERPGQNQIIQAERPYCGDAVCNFGQASSGVAMESPIL